MIKLFRFLLLAEILKKSNHLTGLFVDIDKNKKGNLRVTTQINTNLSVVARYE